MPLTPEQQAEIDEQRAQTAPTARVVAPGMEQHLYTAHPVLDHGFVRVIDYMGDDAAVVQAARVSYGAGTRSVRDDAGLIRYLMRHWHSTPFEMCEIKLHVKLPIFVARQWIRHRTANVNEYSARYSILDREFYQPAEADLAVQSASNRQGRGESLSGAQAAEVLQRLKAGALGAYDDYLWLLGETGGERQEGQELPGLARELARMVLPVSYYTQWYWKVDLHNLLHFLSLRADPHAQMEIRVYAETILEVVKAWVPIAHAAFEDYILGAVSLSRPALGVVRRMIAGETVGQDDSGLTAREWRELMTALGREG